MVATSKEYKQNDFILRTNTAIIVTSHPGHRMFLEATLENYMKTGKYVILSYDSHKSWPHNEIMNIPHTVVSKPITYGAEKRVGWLYDVVLAGGVINPLQNIETVIITNGDCIWEVPQNVDSLRAYVDRHDGDMMCVTADSTLHTAAMVMKAWVFQQFVDYIVQHLKYNVPQSYSPEVLLRDYVHEQNIKVVYPKSQPLYPDGHIHANKIDHYASYNQDHTWKELVGFRNLGAEMKVICQQHLNPLPKKFFYMRNNGEFFNQHERETLYNFYLTGDYRYLYMYFDTGEDSFFNRRYLPLEYYGDEKLIDDTMRREFGPYSERTGFFNKWKYNSYIIKDEEFEKKWKKIIQEKYPELLRKYNAK